MVMSLPMCNFHMAISPPTLLRDPDPNTFTTDFAHARLPVQLNLISGKQLVNLLQREISCLRIEEIDHREEGKVEDAKVYVCPVAEVLDTNGGNFHD